MVQDWSRKIILTKYFTYLFSNVLRLYLEEFLLMVHIPFKDLNYLEPYLYYASIYVW
jgi:hypothetical protein